MATAIAAKAGNSAPETPRRFGCSSRCVREDFVKPARQSPGQAPARPEAVDLGELLRRPRHQASSRCAMCPHRSIEDLAHVNSREHGMTVEGEGSPRAFTAIESRNDPGAVSLIVLTAVGVLVGAAAVADATKHHGSESRMRGTGEGRCRAR